MAPSFFNLPAVLDANHANGSHVERVLGPRQNHVLHTHWRTLDDQSMSSSALMDAFANDIPLVRQRGFLTPEECEKMLDIVKTHKIVGLHNDYFSGIKEAESLQVRWKEEAGIDIMQRVADSLGKTTGMPVRRAKEGEREYFAGVLRALDTGIQIHSDFAPYEGAGWEIGRVAAQLSWNILLNKVPGGDTFIYDREWQAPEDDMAWRKEFPKYAYDPKVVEGRAIKVMSAVAGDLTFFNPRNFHEVRPCDVSKEAPTPMRFTVSSFVGYLPASGCEPPTLVLWS
ncbi:hypothetical protein M406DRAFT_280107 [Cryphonectria parasitica EP155]|uniref:Uncharacterized protein n=1 Tax=Cryphonectria parasitica (strain ATCC 38755 / EP155) TaxID=660469 RepID=A0A9P5CNL2_CRYP1|nr:uncharacterized protein M406DRAFT_280107 [Cryphonectria parasitica EP155]KAF3764030.1 hypothetical protein M406DRAFT_280107 [Cryphonectria parasitica EP155]